MMLLFQQIRRDPALRSLRYWLPLIALTFFFVLGLAVDERPGLLEPPIFMTLGWGFLGLYLGLGPVSRRASAFDLALPIDARRQWLGHLAALALGGALMLGGLFLPLALVERFGELTKIDLGLGRHAVLLAATFLLAAALLEGKEPRLAETPSGGAALTRRMPVIVGVWALLLVLIALPTAVTVLPILAAGILVARTWRRLPAGFVVAPREGAAAGPRAENLSWESVAGTLRPNVLLRVGGIVARHPFYWAILPTIFVYGLILGGLLVAESGDPDERYIFLPLAVYLLIAFAELGPKLLPRFDALPISRAKIFALVILPQLAVLALGYGAGHLAMLRVGSPYTAEGPLFPVLLVLVGVPWFLVLALHYRLCRVAVSAVKRGIVLWGTLAALMGLMILQFFLAKNDVLKPYEVRTALEGFTAALGASPAGQLLAWLGGAVVITAAYLFAAGRFEHVEAPVKVDRCSGSPVS